jgi:bidirectional [NiFe] hydrogenase diaphorase subunit
MKRHQFQADALIEVLHKAQELFGFLENDLLLYIAHSLRLPPSRVYGVATFYHFFSLKPKGEHTCVVCMGTACYVKGAATVLAALEHAAGIRAGETSADRKVSILTARCLGACGIAPALVFDGAVAGHQTAQAALERVKGWLAHGSG